MTTWLVFGVQGESLVVADTPREAVELGIERLERAATVAGTAPALRPDDRFFVVDSEHVHSYVVAGRLLELLEDSGA